MSVRSETACNPRGTVTEATQAAAQQKRQKVFLSLRMHKGPKLAWLDCRLVVLMVMVASHHLSCYAQRLQYAQVQAFSPSSDTLISEISSVLTGFSPGVAGQRFVGIMGIASPLDGCGPLSGLHGRILLTRIHSRSNCSALDITTRAANAGAVAVVNSAAIGVDTMFFLDRLPSEAGVPTPSIVMAAIAAHAGDAIMALAAPTTLQIDVVPASSVSTLNIGGLTITSVMISFVVVSFLLFCTWHCRLSVRHRGAGAAAALPIVRPAPVLAGPADNEAHASAIRNLVVRDFSNDVSADADTDACGSGGAAIGSAAEVCAVCLCAYEAGDRVCSLPCAHDFHHACVVPWLQDHATCPLCKRDVAASDACSNVAASMVSIETAV